MNDFEYKQILLRKPDGSLIKAFKIVDLPEGEKGQISEFLEKSVTKNLKPGLPKDENL
jgi:hypothetical protein